MSAASFDELRTEREPRATPYRDEDFPGCESFHLPASEVDHYDGRLEFWDGATETAWKIPETPIQHEGPSRRLTQMAARFEMVRGSPTSSFGSSDLVRVDAAGRKRWLMQADEMLYMHPDRVRLQGPAIYVDADPLPDVVLEVDHTTDVRRRKLGIYKESGFPEIWVLVPWESSVRAPGLTIHVRHGEEYREEEASPAFSGWRAEEIHRALTESPLSEEAWRALERAALAMGAREGTKPDDDPLMRSHSVRTRTNERIDMVAAVFRARGVEGALNVAEIRELLGGLPGDAAMAAALACTDAADFRRRVRELRARHGRHGPGAAHGEGGALTESPVSEEAWRALERVALAMGAHEGTKPDDDPLMRSHSVRARAKERMEMVAAVFRARGVEGALDVAEIRELVVGLPGDALVAAALACTDADDFLRRVREPGEPRGRHDPTSPHRRDGP